MGLCWGIPSTGARPYGHAPKYIYWWLHVGEYRSSVCYVWSPDIFI